MVPAAAAAAGAGEDHCKVEKHSVYLLNIPGEKCNPEWDQGERLSRPIT